MRRRESSKHTHSLVSPFNFPQRFFVPHYLCVASLLLIGNLYRFIRILLDQGFNVGIDFWRCPIQEFFLVEHTEHHHWQLLTKITNSELYFRIRCLNYFRIRFYRWESVNKERDWQKSDNTYQGLCWRNCRVFVFLFLQIFLLLPVDSSLLRWLHRQRRRRPEEKKLEHTSKITDYNPSLNRIDWPLLYVEYNSIIVIGKSSNYES